VSNYLVVYKHWKNHPDLQPALKEELLALQNEAEIEDRFYTHLQFGTAGLRGVLGAGTNRMNLYTIRRATHGFARYLIETGEANRTKGVAIAYDSRHLSREFALEAACVLAACGIKAYLFQELRPTPMLSFAVRHLQAAGGIVITASHNPPEYNGYKVYQATGGQISEDTADQIWQKIAAIEDELSLPALSLEEGISRGLIQMLGAEIDEAYQAQLSTLLLQPAGHAKAKEQLCIVYTPLHGTGLVPVTQALRGAGFTQLHIVEEQATPDPNFSTVSSPNPEEAQAFTRAIQLAQQTGADIVLGTDPDADRVGMAVRTEDDSYRMLTGNQIGALLLHYLLEQRSAQGRLPDNGLAIKTIVSSELGRSIARAYGVTMIDTLTGFKYIAEKIERSAVSGSQAFLFGYEESYGYLIGEFVRDKDAIQAALLLSEMAAFYKDQAQTLDEALILLQERFGYYCDRQHSVTCKGKEGVAAISRMMETLRQNPLPHVAGLAVVQIKDYQQGIEGLPASNVLKYILVDGSWFALRPSGTEPKIKLYVSAVDSSAEQAEKKADALSRLLVQYMESSTK